MHSCILNTYVLQKEKCYGKDLDDIKDLVPKDFWLTHKNCAHVLCIVVHRQNPEFTKKIMKESSVTVADQKKNKKTAVEKERSAVKERAQLMAKSAMNPHKVQELKIQKKVAKDLVATNNVKRVEKKLLLLEKFKDQLPADEYSRRVQAQLDKLEESSSSSVSQESKNKDEFSSEEEDI